jgi:hypothetical protein
MATFSPDEITPTFRSRMDLQDNGMEVRELAQTKRHERQSWILLPARELGCYTTSNTLA